MSSAITSPARLPNRVPDQVHDVGAPTRSRSRDGLDGFREHRRTGGLRIRNELVLAHRGLAVAMARRYAGRGLDHDDLEQVAMVGLIAAIERFDPDRGVSFASFAVPTILGELRHHFRDHGWMIRVPRRLQQLRRDVSATQERLQHEQGAPPRPDEVADALGEDVSDVLQVLGELASCYRPGRLDDQSDHHLPRDPQPTERRACTDVTVDRCLRVLDARERRIMVLRFYGAMTQQEVADRVGLSQMHVSRLLRTGLAEMRAAA